jgi:hypothetical protein
MFIRNVSRLSKEYTAYIPEDGILLNCVDSVLILTDVTPLSIEEVTNSN